MHIDGFEQFLLWIVLWFVFCKLSRAVVFVTTTFDICFLFGYSSLLGKQWCF
jgi:hypothetical protein